MGSVANEDPARRERQRDYERKYTETHRDEIRERQRVYREANRDKRREQGRRYREAHPDRNREYREANKDSVRAQQKAYREANRDKILPRKRARQREYYREAKKDPATVARWRAAQRTYRETSRQKVNESSLFRKHGLTSHAWSLIWDSQEGKCYLCERELDRSDAVIDHDHRCCPPHSSCRECRRGLACGRCNGLIGFADDDPDRLTVIAHNLREAIQEVSLRIASRQVQAVLFEDAT